MFELLSLGVTQSAPHKIGIKSHLRDRKRRKIPFNYHFCFVLERNVLSRTKNKPTEEPEIAVKSCRWVVRESHKRTRRDLFVVYVCMYVCTCELVYINACVCIYYTRRFAINKIRKRFHGHWTERSPRAYACSKPSGHSGIGKNNVEIQPKTRISEITVHTPSPKPVSLK